VHPNAAIVRIPSGDVDNVIELLKSHGQLFAIAAVVDPPDTQRWWHYLAAATSSATPRKLIRTPKTTKRFSIGLTICNYASSCATA
jgi:hypothetical protein